MQITVRVGHFNPISAMEYSWCTITSLHRVTVVQCYQATPINQAGLNEVRTLVQQMEDAASETRNP